METKVSQKLPEVLLDKSVEYHCRRGLRSWCDCDYCAEKRNGTARIAHIGTTANFSFYGHVSIAYENYELWAYIVRQRREQAKKLRDKLNDIKQVVVTQGKDHDK